MLNQNQLNETVNKLCGNRSPMGKKAMPLVGIVFDAPVLRHGVGTGWHCR